MPVTSPPKRYVLSGMIFVGFFVMSGLRVNLNVAIGAMVNNHTAVVDGQTICREAEFHWEPKLRGVILGAFYYGYMIFQIPGGWLALRLGGARLFGIAILVASIFTLLTPMATRWSPIALIVLRILEGLALGVLFPCNHAIWSRWAPLAERTTLVTVSITGTSIGYLLTMPISGVLSKYGFDGGWASVFYCFGIFGIVWYLIWMMTVYESPATHPTISDEEKSLIQATALDLSNVDDFIVPWKSIISSPPVWGIIAANFALDWAFYILLISMPTFLMDVMKTSITKMGFLAAAPFLVKGLCTPMSGLSADILRKSRASTSIVRKVFYAVGAVASGFLILIAGYSMDVTVVVICMGLAGMTTSLAFPAYTVNMLDIAPRFASIIMGICNTIGTTAGFVSPIVVGFITQHKCAKDWQEVFWISFAILVAGTLLFCALTTGERQEWDKTETKPTEDDIIESQSSSDRS
ncbi:vesicular glutamate transporter 2-like [Acropora muricata]|uniref:vesicular glutamate transporter 2-like n=1 Tax=Acropora muricata TaxID=159855 RepID=UPI0034E4DD18